MRIDMTCDKASAIALTQFKPMAFLEIHIMAAKINESTEQFDILPASALVPARTVASIMALLKNEWVKRHEG
jgi:hypothetical protein